MSRIHSCASIIRIRIEYYRIALGAPILSAHAEVTFWYCPRGIAVVGRREPLPWIGISLGERRFEFGIVSVYVIKEVGCSVLVDNGGSVKNQNGN